MFIQFGFCSYYLRLSGNIIILFFIGFIYSGCKKPLNNNVTVIFDSSFNFIDEIDISSEDYTATFNHSDSILSYDTSSKSLIFKKDSLANGEYSFIIKTIFSKKQIFTVSIFSDTIFYLKNQLGISKVELIEKRELLNADTIEIVYTIDGCFQSDFEKSTLIKGKSENIYSVHTISTKLNLEGNPTEFRSRVGQFVIDSLFYLQTESIKQMKEANENAKKNGWPFSLLGSTTVKRFYILVNHKAFFFTDYGLKEWNFYDSFRARFID